MADSKKPSAAFYDMALDCALEIEAECPDEGASMDTRLAASKITSLIQDVVNTYQEDHRRECTELLSRLNAAS